MPDGYHPQQQQQQRHPRHMAALDCPPQHQQRATSRQDLLEIDQQEMSLPPTPHMAPQVLYSGCDGTSWAAAPPAAYYTGGGTMGRRKLKSQIPVPDSAPAEYTYSHLDNTDDLFVHRAMQPAGTPYHNEYATMRLPSKRRNCTNKRGSQDPIESNFRHFPHYAAGESQIFSAYNHLGMSLPPGGSRSKSTDRNLNSVGHSDEDVYRTGNETLALLPREPPDGIENSEPSKGGGGGGAHHKMDTMSRKNSKSDLLMSESSVNNPRASSSVGGGSSVSGLPSASGGEETSLGGGDNVSILSAGSTLTMPGGGAGKELLKRDSIPGGSSAGVFGMEGSGGGGGGSSVNSVSTTVTVQQQQQGGGGMVSAEQDLESVLGTDW